MTHPFRFAAVTALAMAAVACAHAQSGEGWTSTKTRRLEPREAVAGAAMKPGESIHVAVSLRLRNRADLDALTHALMSGRNAHHLTREEFQARHAPADADVAAVVDHLRQAGFVNVKVADNHLLVSADGTAAAVKSAFNTDLRHYAIQGREAYANTADAQVPAHLADIVTAVHGLQTVSTLHSMLKIAAKPQGAGTSEGHDPFDFPQIYGATNLPAATKSTIGIIADGDISQSLRDLDAFNEKNHLDVDSKEVDVGTQGTDTAGVIEWNLDSQVALAAAGGKVKQLIFYVATSLEDAPLTEAFNQAVTDRTAQVINVSLGECEDYAAESGLREADDAIFQVAMAQGQTFSVASGDGGSYECGSATGGQSYPASSPYVMAIGGTLVKTTNQVAWTEESTWACRSDLGCLMYGGSGGGVSSTEEAPDWQVKSGVLKGSTKRGVPDIALAGDPDSGALVMMDGETLQVGGTSLSAPLFAGFWARLQTANDNKLHFPGSGLYKYGVDPANATSMFHDVVKGKNGGYGAATGWDYTTGFGSLDVGKLATFIGTHPGF